MSGPHYIILVMSGAEPDLKIENEIAFMHDLFEYVTITRLGEMFGVTRIEMGRWLVKIGLRERNYKEYCRPRWQ